MNKEDYVRKTNERLNNKIAKEIMIRQINTYYDVKDNYKLSDHNYKLNDEVILKKGTLLHGTYKNIDGLKEIVKNGLMSSWFIDGRGSKYPCSVGVWNLKQNYYLKDYINYYSGGTIKYTGLLIDNEYSNGVKTDVIPYSNMNNIINTVIKNQSRMWYMEQTKEARFMPSLVQDKVQIGIIFNYKYVDELLKGDILNPCNISDTDVKEFVDEWYYEKFIIDRKNKDDFFTDRESAILFGIPSNLIEGILVGKEYENNKDILKEIKELLPYCYICNLDGRIIVC